MIHCRQGTPVRRSRRSRGFTLIEVLIATVVLLALLPLIAGLFNQFSERLTAQAAGKHLKQVIDAARPYVQANFSTLQSTATATTPATIRINDLQNPPTPGDRFLDASFQPTNVWNQDYTIYVLQPQPDDLLVLVLTEDGRGDDPDNPAFARSIIPRAAKAAGDQGGFVASGDLGTQTNEDVIGAFGGWRFDLAGVDIPTPGAGHLAGLVYMESGEVANDHLYRVGVNGEPQLNEMQVDLDMDGNTINMGGTDGAGNPVQGDVGGGDEEGVRSINFEEKDITDFTCPDNDNHGGRVFYDRERGLFVCRAGEIRRIRDAGNARQWFDNAAIGRPLDTVSFPNDCPAGTTPRVFTAASWMAKGSQAKEMAAFQTWAEDVGGAHRLRARVLTEDGWTNDPSQGTRVLAIQTCG